MLHILNEQSEHDELNTMGIEKSMDNWWANCIRNSGEREWVGRVIKKVRNLDYFVFTRDMYEKALERRKETGSFVDPDPDEA